MSVMGVEENNINKRMLRIKKLYAEDRMQEQ